MRKVKLTGEEANLVFASLENGDPQRGLSLADVRTVMPILEKLEAQADRQAIPGGEKLVFHDNTELVLKESEFTTLKAKLEGSTGWANASVGRRVVKIIDRLTETPADPDKEGA